MPLAAHVDVRTVIAMRHARILWNSLHHTRPTWAPKREPTEAKHRLQASCQTVSCAGIPGACARLRFMLLVYQVRRAPCGASDARMCGATALQANVLLHASPPRVSRQVFQFRPPARGSVVNPSARAPL